MGGCLQAVCAADAGIAAARRINYDRVSRALDTAGDVEETAIAGADRRIVLFCLGLHLRPAHVTR